ncbi:AraC family transcriptional regulator [Flavihumibacter profundi]|uniref:AraC family transcriptional regulator n=1 Tax=Flavihumibacter profundi TaxID=2716883 RepID=UPI001CC46E4A|nr:helix-turn-helix domain-containing protein [Flavihumibacter profundi]MBZ5857709.1 helix-turn-helix domain-containing protein [Flavihumibacter profundi]
MHINKSIVHFGFSNTDFTYQIYQPQGDDKVLVDFYCEVLFSPDSANLFTRAILPFPGCELVFYLHGEAKTTIHETEEAILSKSYLFGQPSITRKFQVSPGARIFVVRIKQHLFKSFLHDYTNWQDRIFPLQEIAGEDSWALFSQLNKTQSFEDNISIAQQAMARLINKKPDENFQWLQTIEGAIPDNTSVARLAKRTHITIRQLERQFNTYFDLTPQEYLRLKKLANALDHYARSPNTSVTDASYIGGFADQAHFIKTFRFYSPLAPFRFFRNYNIKKH